MERRQDRAHVCSDDDASVEEVRDRESHATSGQGRTQNLQATLDAALIRAVYHQNIEATFDALKQGANPNADADEGMHPLHFAALYGNPNLLHLLIDYNADVNLLCGGSGLSALHCATLMGHATSVNLLLERNANPDVVTSFTARTPLQIAVSVVRPESVQITRALIEHGANVNIVEDEDMTLLHICGNDASMVKLLVDAGVNPMAVSKKELTPLHRACRNGYLRKVKALVKGGARVNDAMHSLKSPLHCACDGGHLEVVRYLVEEAGADTFCQDRSGKLPIHQACKMKQRNIVDFFLDECGFSPSVQDGKGNTCLHWACKKADNAFDDDAIEDNICTFVESLLNRMPALIDLPNFHQQIPLHYAAVWNASLCQVLVEQYKADVTKRDQVGQTPLILAARQGVISTVSYFTGNAAVDNDAGDCQNWTALHWAAFRYNERMIRKLLQNGANANVKSTRGRTPLHLISRFDFPSSFQDRDILLDGIFDRTILFPSRPDMENHCVEILLEHGSDCMIIDRRGDLPFFLAAATGSVNDTYLMMREAIGRGLFDNATSKLKASSCQKVEILDST